MASASAAIRDSRRRCRTGSAGGRWIPTRRRARSRARELRQGLAILRAAGRQPRTAPNHRPAFVLGHAVELQPTPAPFECRRAMLFVGAFGADSPNDDAIRFFCRDVLPELRSAGCRAPLVVAGARIPDRLKAESDSTVLWHS